MHRLLLCCLLALGACKKEAATGPVSVSRFSSGQLVGTWRITSAVSGEAYAWGGGAPTTNVYSGSYSCAAQNSYSFSEGGAGSFSVCGSTSTGGQWKLEEDILRSRNSPSDGWTEEAVQTVSSNMMTTTEKVARPGDPAQTTSITYTYVRQ
ncbi:MAG: hypothetical protein EOO11_10345 [Chitinophagaceae bacterium]|nr:MAG: hypothetical protein EOO11_10345 [Chitinophagaceae bacterium]